MANGLDLLVWLDAGSRDSIVLGYARALADIKVAAPPGQPEAAATAFLAWLADTGRRWLVVLDGLAEPADAEGLWPHGPAGQALVTTSVARLSQEPSTSPTGSPSPETIAVPAFSEREALSYLSARLSEDPYHTAGSLDLAIAAGCLPAGLALAVTYLLDSGQDCRQYRLACERYRQRWQDGGAGDPLAPFWMLAVDRARQYAPADLAWPALKLAAVLGPARIPGAVLTSSAACALCHRARRGHQRGPGERAGRVRKPGAVRPGHHRPRRRRPHGGDGSRAPVIGPPGDEPSRTAAGGRSRRRRRL